MSARPAHLQHPAFPAQIQRPAWPQQQTHRPRRLRLLRPAAQRAEFAPGSPRWTVLAVRQGQRGLIPPEKSEQGPVGRRGKTITGKQEPLCVAAHSPVHKAGNRSRGHKRFPFPAAGWLAVVPFAALRRLTDKDSAHSRFLSREVPGGSAPAGGLAIGMSIVAQARERTAVPGQPKSGGQDFRERPSSERMATPVLCSVLQSDRQASYPPATSGLPRAGGAKAGEVDCLPAISKPEDSAQRYSTDRAFVLCPLTGPIRACLHGSAASRSSGIGRLNAGPPGSSFLPSPTLLRPAHSTYSRSTTPFPNANRRLNAQQNMKRQRRWPGLPPENFAPTEPYRFVHVMTLKGTK